jgi:hypothetical protein
VLEGAPTFENYVAPLLASKCTGCHGELATGGLNMLTYADLMNGSANGPIVVPGDASSSILYEVQSAGKHFSNLTAEELELVKQWIDAGAPEN